MDAAFVASCHTAIAKQSGVFLIAVRLTDRLDNWTFEILETLCAAGRSESDRPDFSPDGH